MKTAIELLEDVAKTLSRISPYGDYEDSKRNAEYRNMAHDLIWRAISELKARWYTPEQWKKRTGKAWPDDWAVYWRAIHFNGLHGDWKIASYGLARVHSVAYLRVECVCATEAGIPPDNWKLET
jgi:hypothetical protein